MTMRILPSIAFPILIALSLSACGSTDRDPSSSEDPPPSTPLTELHYELLPWTHELTSETLAHIQVSEDDGTVRVTGAPIQLSELKTGDVLLAGLSPTTPRGLLRFVIEVHDDDGDIVIDTVPAPVQAAFLSLHAKIPANATMLDGSSAGLQSTGIGTTSSALFSTSKSVGGGQAIDWQVFDQDGNRETKDDQLYVSGQVTGSLLLMASIDLDWLESPARIAEEIACLTSLGLFCQPSLPDVKLSVRAEAIAAVEIDAEGAAAKSFESDEFPIDGSEFDLEPIVAGPIVIFPSIAFVAQVSGSSNSRFHTKAGIKYQAITEASIGVTSGASMTPPTVTREITPPFAEVSLSSDLKASVGPRIELMFWGTFGPSVSALGYAKLRANTNETPCLALDVGAELSVKLSLRIPWKVFGAEQLGKALGLAGDILSKRFGPFEIFSVPNVKTGTCQVLPADVYPPGEGPSLDAYSNPKFTPWSRRFGDQSTWLYQFPYSSQAPQTVIHAEKSVDNSLLASGRGIYGFLKMSEFGDLRWAKNVKIARLDSREFPIDRPSMFVTQALNTNLWAASSRFSLMQFDQDGELLWARRFVPVAPPGDEAGDKLFALGSQLDAVSIVQTNDGGLYILYALQHTPNNGPAILVRVDSKGELLWAKRIAFESDKTMVSVLALDGDELMLAGQSWVGVPQVARLLRMRANGSLVFAKRIDVCGNKSVRPSQLLRLASGAFAILGNYDTAVSKSFLLQVPSDASRVSSIFTWQGDQPVEASAIAQLPTTGFVTASVRNALQGSQIRIAHHDAQGSITKERELAWTAPSDGWTNDQSPGALRLSTDGGLVIFAHSAQTTNNPAIWVSKIPVSTLDVDFGSAPVTVSTPVSTPTSCTAALTDEVEFALEDVEFEQIDVTDKITVQTIPLDVETYLPQP